MTKEELWQATLAEIELNISKANFNTWFRNTSIRSQKEGGVVISVPNGFSKEWLENKFNKVIFKTLRDLAPETKEVAFVIESKKQAAQKTLHASRKAPAYPSLTDQLTFEQLNIDGRTNLNPKYVFDSFVVGSSNELAHAAAFSVAQKPGKEHNPLFIYGGVGLGKTHLLQAIGNMVKEKKKGKKIQFLSCEKFTNEFIVAVHNQKIKEFREKYRKVDLLIIDDIQFLARKERTQEEFFHTFNALYEDNKQIVLSSDRPPKSIEFLEERLCSRFEGGMTADIGYPEFETRVAILNKRLRERKVRLSNEVIHYVAENIHNNVRELEGALNILLASSRLEGSAVTLEKARKYLSHVVKRPRRVVSLKKILKAVAGLYDVTEKELLSQNRKREIAHPRQILMYFMREELKNSYPFIGSKLGGRDHTTVIHACSKIGQALKDNNEQIAEEINLLKQEVYTN